MTILDRDEKKDAEIVESIPNCGIDFTRGDDGSIFIFCRFSDNCGPQKGKMGKPDPMFKINNFEDGRIEFPNNFYCRRRANYCDLVPPKKQ